MKRSQESNGSAPSSQRSRGEEDHGMSFEEQLMMLDDVDGMGEEMIPDDIITEGSTVALQKNKTVPWKRPESVIDSTQASLQFQWMDIDLTDGKPLAKNPAGGPILGAQEGTVPVIRLYGTLKDTSSIMVAVHGFTPYIFACFREDIDLSDGALARFRTQLDLMMREKARTSQEKALPSMILQVEKIDGMQSLQGYHFGKTRSFVKIYVAMPSLVNKLRSLIDSLGVTVNGTLYRGSTYESNVPFILRFMIDKDIQGSDWLELPAGTYSLRPSDSMTSRCTYEADIYFDKIKVHKCEGPWSAIAPIRILSFDIECQGRKGIFPEAQYDPVIQIANTITLQGCDQPMIRNVFVLNTCLPIVGAQVYSSQHEHEMLLNWRAFVNEVDPDVLTGYNIANFDIPYLLNRAKTLEKKHPALKAFADISRLKGVKATMRDTTFQSSAYGKRENIETTVFGRVIFDLLPYMQRNHKLSSYSLNNVSAEFLGQQKEDVHHSIISDLQLGSDSDRRRLAVYCLKDAYLPQQLMNKLSIMVNYIEMARVTGVPLNFLLVRGQQIKVYSMLLRKTKREGLLIPYMSKEGSNDDGVGYEGATVIEPKKAYYEVPVATLDFASLYPSIMQAYNLCYSTLLSRTDLEKLSPDQYEKSPTNDFFVRATTKKGILPQILDELLAARKRAKKDMAAASDPMEKAVQNGRQLALKISANSVYGFTGATVGQLPCVPIASSTTSYGRELLFQTRSFVERTYTRKNGYAHDADVVYGDTDSVMVNFGPDNVEEAMAIAEKAADEVSAIFPKPIKLEFEKVYFPYLLMNKKRYAGLLWTRPEKYDKMDCKGLETVRRDNCLLVRKMVDTCLRKILIDRDVKGAIAYAKTTIADLLQNKLDISMLVISKSLGKSADDAGYKAKQAHVELAMRMKKRDPGSAPNVGDRVAYVIVRAAKNTPAYDKSEDPVYVLDNNIPIDTEYYLSNQLSNPLTRIFEPIIPNPQSLLSGAHTLKVSKPTPKAKSGGIMMFAVKKATCMSCKAVITDNKENGDTPLCTNCKSKESLIYMDKLEAVNEQQRLHSALWTECQRCQGSFHQDVICSNKDCPIFYKRKKVQIDLQAAQDTLDRFAW